MRNAVVLTEEKLRQSPILHQLAHLYGVQLAYDDVSGRRQLASDDVLLKVLQLLGAPVMTMEDIGAALRERQQARWREMLEPVVVAWGGQSPQLEARLPAEIADASLTGYLALETGEQRTLSWLGANLPSSDAADVEGRRYVIKRLSLPEGLPWGYHRFTLEVPGNQAKCLIISAPAKAYSSLDGPGQHTWGVFLPLYALHTERSWGSGDLTDLETLIEWTVRMGGGVVATLPLLAAFLGEEIFEPSPYAPASRLLWSEFYIDVTRAAELEKCPSAQAMIASAPFQEEIRGLRDAALVDYGRQMALKRRVLEELSRTCFAEATPRLEALRRFVADNPLVEDYACFRAACESRRSAWRSWPESMRKGTLGPGDYDEGTKNYYLYSQWLVSEHMKSLSHNAREKGPGLYVDLPLGVHSDGYDVWRYQDLFVHGASLGAPPDALFTGGQDWGVPPLHPEKSRYQGYGYYISCLRHHMRHAGILRIDHMMGLNRLFWVPWGMSARQGVYVRNRPDELYAVLVLESFRAKTMVVGEDLGTVPPEVRPTMARHNVHRMYVAQYEFVGDSRSSLKPVPANTVASLNTHDMPPFAAFWQGLDLQDRRDLGLLNDVELAEEQRGREYLREAITGFLQRESWAADIVATEPEEVLKALLRFLGASAAPVVLANLEDLWTEMGQQNVPGTWRERPNWRRKARCSFEAFAQKEEVVSTLQMLNHLRRRRVGGG